jgi:GDP-L-fucose synthase
VKVLVLGSTGLAGSAILAEFQSLGYEAIGINRSTLDFSDEVATSNAFRDYSPQIIVNAAAKVGGIIANNSTPVEFLSENLIMQLNICKAAHEANVEKLVFLGSSCIYPRDALQPIKEEYLMTGRLEKTNSAYSIAKIAGIELINSYRKEFGRRWISLMPTNLYGPRDNYNLVTSHVFPALIRKFIEAVDSNAERITLWGTGKPRREFLHVSDLASAVSMVSSNYDSDLHLNIGTGEDISIKELSLKIAEIVDFRGEIEWDVSKPDGTPRKVLDVSRIKALGWNPTISLDEGITSTIAWYKEANSRGEVRK